MPMKTVVTPLVELNVPDCDNHIFIKRDDLLPFSFGGNKARIAEEFFADMAQKGKNCIVGYGNARSNLSRAIATMASAKGIPCYIVSPADDDGKRYQTANSRLVEACNAQFRYCAKTQVAETVAAVMAECEAQGFDPYYVNGDRFGKGNEAVPVRAYTKVYDEIHEQSAALGVTFDYLFLPTGTGMTQAGLLVGQALCGGTEQVVGISVAREASAETEILKRYVTAGGTERGVTVSDTALQVTDAYLCGGYGKWDETIRREVVAQYRQNGLPLDPTYTGKGFAGMKRYLKDNGIKGKTVLFLHTGGTPLFFDQFKRMQEPPRPVLCDKAEDLVSFLKRIDSRLPVPLTARVDLQDFAEKVIRHGNPLVIYEGDTIAAAALFYSNDQQTRNAYLTLLVTDEAYEGRGYARVLMAQAERIAAAAGMQWFYLDTQLTNHHAIAFYSQQGWTIDTVGEKVHMKKELFQ